MQTDATHAPGRHGASGQQGLSDELKGAFYAVVETPSGRAYHVHQEREEKDDQISTEFESKKNVRA
jgi:hypothetical protein